MWYTKSRERAKFRNLFLDKSDSASVDALYRHVMTNDGLTFRGADPANFHADREASVFRIDQLTSQTQAKTTRCTVEFEGDKYPVGQRQWATPIAGMKRLIASSRVTVSGKSLAYIRRLDDYPVVPVRNIWTDTGTGSFTDPKVYVVQTNVKLVQRCILMATDPGDLVLDPTCGSGTTAHVAEQ